MTREIMNNSWLELSITAPAEYVEPLSVVFQRYGHGGVVIEQLGGYNPDEDDEVDNTSDAILEYTFQLIRLLNLVSSKSR